MKVLQINSVCGVGSTGRIATDIHAKLLEKGYQSYIAYGRGKPRNIDEKYAIKIGGKMSQFIHLIKTRIFDKHGYGSKRATKNLIKEIKLINPDVIHLHNIHGYYINIKILFKFLKKYNGKVVWTLHDAWPITGHSCHFTFPEYKGWNNGIHSCGGKKNYPRSYISDRRIKNGKEKIDLFSGVKNMTIVTPSIWLKNLIDKSHLKNYNSVVINNGINTNVFKPVENNFKYKYKIVDKKVYLGVASPWSERKGFNEFIGLSKHLKGDEVIFLVGLSNKQLKKLPENILGITRTENIEELVEIYSGSDIFINPTFEDNYPTVNLEAAACGLPIITYETGGSPESASVGTHIVVKNNNVQSILDSIREINIDKNNNNMLSKNISVEHMVEQYIKEYIKI